MNNLSARVFGTAIVKRVHRDRVDIAVGASAKWWRGIRVVGPVTNVQVDDTVIVYKADGSYFVLAPLKG